jgi:hypothetical protein
MRLVPDVRALHEQIDHPFIRGLVSFKVNLIFDALSVVDDLNGEKISVVRVKAFRRHQPVDDSRQMVRQFVSFKIEDAGLEVVAVA